jgi:hypothetical protein
VLSTLGEESALRKNQHEENPLVAGDLSGKGNVSFDGRRGEVRERRWLPRLWRRRHDGRDSGGKRECTSSVVDKSAVMERAQGMLGHSGSHGIALSHGKGLNLLH